MTKRKVHYADRFICNRVCGLCSEVDFLETTFNKRKVTCKRCKKTKIYKQRNKK